MSLLSTLERAADRADATFIRHIMHICKQLQRPALEREVGACARTQQEPAQAPVGLRDDTPASVQHTGWARR